MFPKDIYFCHKKIDDKITYHTNNWKKLNPSYKIYLYDDEMCEDFLNKHFGNLHSEIFKFIKHGPIKADFWRICILYKNGGIYSDVDNEPLIPLDEFIENDVDLVTCSSYWDKKFNFNPNFIISNKNNIILKNCIDEYVRLFTTKKKYNYWDWSIMKIFTDILHINNYNKQDGIYNYNGLKIQILKECKGIDHYDAHNIYKNKRIFNNRYKTWNFYTHSFIGGKRKKLYNINYTNVQSGGGDIADFIPYSDHYKLSEKTKIQNPKYCPDLFPYLCNEKSSANGKCRKNINDCQKIKINNEKDISHLFYKSNKN